jgi:excisionase family DNA binding protein
MSWRSVAPVDTNGCRQFQVCAMKLAKASLRGRQSIPEVFPQTSTALSNAKPPQVCEKQKPDIRVFWSYEKVKRATNPDPTDKAGQSRLSRESHSTERMWLSIDEFRSLSGLSIKTIRRRIESGGIKAIQLGGAGTKWLIDKQALEQLAGNQQPGRTASSPGEVGPEITGNANQRAPRRAGPRPRWKEESF